MDIDNWKYYCYNQTTSVINFIKTFSEDYKVAAFFPSTKFAAKKIASEIKPEYKVVVEYGAGDGAVTKELLKVLPADGKLIAVELNSNFVKELQKINYKRLEIISDDVVFVSKNLSIYGQIDMVISGISFTLFKPQTREKIISDSYKSINEGGRVLLYQYYLLMLPYMRKACGKNIRWYIEPRNIFPYWVMIAEK